VTGCFGHGDEPLGLGSKEIVNCTDMFFFVLLQCEKDSETM
jgi:hypothetical protein